MEMFGLTFSMHNLGCHKELQNDVMRFKKKNEAWSNNREEEKSKLFLFMKPFHPVALLL